MGCMMMAYELNCSSFRNAKLMASIMDGSDFTDCELENANFQGVDYIETIFPEGFDLERSKVVEKTKINDTSPSTPK
jgi:uncharacterized protein YjbI with pentapeptide repeats